MQTLGHPDNGPSPLWKNVLKAYDSKEYLNLGKYGNEYLPQYDLMATPGSDSEYREKEHQKFVKNYIPENMSDRTKSEFKHFCNIGGPNSSRCPLLE